MRFSTRALLLFTVFYVTGVSTATADIFNGNLTDDVATVVGGGVGQDPTTDFLGVVTAASPLEINGTSSVASGFTPAIGDIIGRDLVSTGFNFTGDSVTWEVNIPTVNGTYIANTFDLTANFNASTAFLGNAFGGGQPNALDFDLLFDGASQGTFQAQSGVHTSAPLSGSIASGDPISLVQVRMTFPGATSFNANTEEFHVFADSLVVDYSYQFTAVPEPSSLAVVALFGVVGLMRRRRR